MGFEVVDLPLTVSSSSERSGEDHSSSGGGGSNGAGKEHKMQIRNHEEKLASEFRDRVSSKCTDEAVVVVYVSGIQFPCEVRGA